VAHLLGIDVGTSATKVVLTDGGRIVATAEREHPISMPRAGWSEQDPRDWWRATAAGIRAVLEDSGVAGGEIAGISLSGQMHGSVLLESEPAADGSPPEPLRKAILWNDQRTSAECEAIERAVGGRRRLVEITGNAALPGFTLPKLLWVRGHEPDVFARARRVLLPKDFVRLCLTGREATDVGDGAGTLAMDVDARTWSDDVSGAVGLERSLLPDLVESGEIAGEVTGWAAGETGLAAGTPVVAGSGDNMMGAIGAGVVEEGVALATLGTSGVIYAHAARPHRDLLSDEVCGRTHTMCAADGRVGAPGGWCVTGCMLSAAGSLAWARETLFPQESYDALLAEAAAAPPGCEGLLFLPYLTGERCPHPDPCARGGWIGLTSRHGRGHLVRAVVEGVTFGMGEILDLVRSIGVRVESVRLGGGGARSAFWRQLQADVYGVPVALTSAVEGPAFGAALAAGVGAGVWPSVAEACRETVRETEVLEPDPASQGRYAAPREHYASLYHALRERFAALGEV